MTSDAERSFSTSQREKLNTYVDLLRKWTQRINLVSRKSLDEIWERHILDSAQVFDVAGAVSGKWLDIGSGGGLPGAVVAILAEESAPDLKVTCVESDQRKAAFLRTVSRETSAQFEVLDSRIEELAPQNASVVSARALAPLSTLLEFAERHLGEGGVAVFPKGEGQAAEFLEAQARWAFESDAIPSTTRPGSVLYKIRGVRRV